MREIRGDLYAALEVPQKHVQTAISRDEGEFLFQFLTSHRLMRTIETGFAIGVSAAYILSATRTPHNAIDPNPDQYDDLGLKNLAAIGLSDLLRLWREPSHIALPRLLQEGLRIDFAFIDGDHRFDGAFLDFYYIDLMLDRCGFVAFHDVWMPATQTVLAWIAHNKLNYRRIDVSKGNLAIVQKLSEDQRQWTHFRDFHVRSSLFGWRKRRLARLKGANWSRRFGR